MKEVYKCSMRHCDNDAIWDGICAKCYIAIDEGLECYGATTMLVTKWGRKNLGDALDAE